MHRKCVPMFLEVFFSFDQDIHLFMSNVYHLPPVANTAIDLRRIRE